MLIIAQSEPIHDGWNRRVAIVGEASVRLPAGVPLRAEKFENDVRTRRPIPDMEQGGIVPYIQNGKQ